MIRQVNAVEKNKGLRLKVVEQRLWCKRYETQVTDNRGRRGAGAGAVPKSGHTRFEIELTGRKA